MTEKAELASLAVKGDGCPERQAISAWLMSVPPRGSAGQAVSDIYQHENNACYITISSVSHVYCILSFGMFAPSATRIAEEDLFDCREPTANRRGDLVRLSEVRSFWGE